MSEHSRVLFATAELTPIAKVGGLADVAGALPPILKKHGVDIRVVLPKYGTIDDHSCPSRLVGRCLPIRLGRETQTINVYATTVPGTSVPLYLVENQKYLGENGIYFSRSAFVNSVDEVHRFVFFSRVLLEIFPAVRWTPQLIHCQDWHVGLVPTLLKIQQQEKLEFRQIKTLFTIHNLANQGIWNKDEVLSFLGLAETELPRPLEGADINLIQQGIRSSDLLNTVSKTYAEEILTLEFGEGLEADLQTRRSALFGIVNGIDQARFNPAKDPELAAQYTTETIELKSKNKTKLQEVCVLPVQNDAPVFGLVSRLTDQKGIELIAEAVPAICRQGGQVCLLGQGTQEFESLLINAQKQFPKNVFAKIGFDAGLAQLIYAGSDFFLMPSRFEPCGLGQLIAMRYGTIPIVRATGGLKDTVADYIPATGQGTGFVFGPYTKEALIEAIERALAVFRQGPDQWRRLCCAAMTFDSSWDKAANEYLQLYQKLIP